MGLGKVMIATVLAMGASAAWGEWNIRPVPLAPARYLLRPAAELQKLLSCTTAQAGEQLVRDCKAPEANNERKRSPEG
jgi:hypothetical protein